MKPPNEKPPKKVSLPRRDDLPAVSVSRFRALKLITPETKRFTITIGGERRTLNVSHLHFPNGGGWSFWVCPSCLRLARTIRLYGDRLVCRRCDGLIARCQTGDKGPAIARLVERVYGPPARLKPGRQAHPPTANKRKLAASLRRTRIIERRDRLKGWES